MKLLPSILSLLYAFCLTAQPVMGQINCWISQSGSGNNSGSDAGNTINITNFNAKICSPGDSNFIVGTLTTNGFGASILANSSSGTPAQPITYYFEPGASITAPVFSSGTYAVLFGYGGSCHDIVVDGGANGIIQCTSNGYALPYQYNIGGMLFVNATRCTVRNLTIANLWVSISGTYNANEGCNAISFGSSSTNQTGGNIVSNCIIHDVATGVSFGYGNVTNDTMINNLVYNINWGGSAGDGYGDPPNTIMNGLRVIGNTISNWQNWDDPAINNHHNGFFTWANGGGHVTNLEYGGNHIGGGYGNNSSGLFTQGRVCGAWVHNNIFDGSDGTHVQNNAYLFINANFGGVTAPGTFSVINNSFICTGPSSSSIAIEVNGGDLTTTTFVWFTNNLFAGIAMPLSLVNITNTGYSWFDDYNCWYNFNSTCPLNYNFADGSYCITYPTWRSYSYEANGNTNNPNLNSLFQPLQGGAASYGLVTASGGAAGAAGYIGALLPYTTNFPSTNLTKIYLTSTNLP